MNASYGFHLNNYSKEIKKDLVDSNCKLYQCFIEEYNDLILYQFVFTKFKILLLPITERN